MGRAAQPIAIWCGLIDKPVLCFAQHRRHTMAKRPKKNDIPKKKTPNNKLFKPQPPAGKPAHKFTLKSGH